MANELSKATGRRKTAVAHVRLISGTGKWTVNGVEVERYIPSESLRAYISDELHVRWRQATQEIRAIVADEELAYLLKIEVGEPLLFSKRISFDTQGMPREFVTTYYRADHYHIEVELDA